MSSIVGPFVEMYISYVIPNVFNFTILHMIVNSDGLSFN